MTKSTNGCDAGAVSTSIGVGFGVGTALVVVRTEVMLLTGGVL